MKITDILGFKHNGLEAIEAKLNGIVAWKNAPAEIEFTTCIFPTSWTAVTTGTSYKASNEYGEWHITATNSYSNSYSAQKAFDNDASTYWRGNDFASGSQTREMEIDCPVQIKPSQFYIKCGRIGDNSKIQGFNEATQAWEDIYILEKATSFEKTVDISTENYYSKFKVVFYRYSSSQTSVQIHEFQVASGFIKGA